MIKFSVPIQPVPFPRPKFNSLTKAAFNSKRYTDYKNAVALIAKSAMRGKEPFTGEIKLTCNFYRNKPKKQPQVSFIGDVDNYLKAIMDALNGICYLDDRQVVDAHAFKLFGIPHVEITLEVM